ncbi:hypothetical protein GCM10007079_09370 [Nocardiopsis terrae]|uniref:Disulfide bond formation protein DsbB n=1 Tax=Nocardiopsis terrae TaxID=372655 RepID=A0ABR9HCT2_9ACTN|nr:hypothetical protein [Nocardiopsis terrae]MBE1456848.1 disulfide bond formation protein DsbB [Nocardiopsis terrae]GHC74806.1 hypothetical protein GCM10007079_09370 [Nocardiopsis terrae]
MSPSRPHRSRTGSAWARILLLTALLLGFGAMHTLGHLQHEAHAPAGPYGGLAEPTAAPPASGHGDRWAGSAEAPASGHAPGTARAPAADHTAPAGAHSAVWEDRVQLPELDPTSACLALAAFTAVLLGVGAVAFTRWPVVPVNPVDPALCSARPPLPGPARPSLARLQVLRV